MCPQRSAIFRAVESVTLPSSDGSHARPDQHLYANETAEISAMLGTKELSTSDIQSNVGRWAVTTKDSGTAASSIAGGSPHRPEQLKNLKRLHLDLCTRLTAEERKDHASRVKAAGPSGTRKRDEAFQATRRRPPTTPRSTRSRSVRGSSRFLSTLQTVTLCLDAGFATR